MNGNEAAETAKSDRSENKAETSEMRESDTTEDDEDRGPHFQEARAKPDGAEESEGSNDHDKNVTVVRG